METGIHNTSEIGRLKKVMLHRPGRELENLMPEYLERLLFDDIPYLKEAQREHDAFADCLRRSGVEVVYLADLAAELAGSDEPKTVAGDGAVLCRDYLTEHGIPCALAVPHLVQQNAVGVALAAEDILRSGGGGTAQELLPVYLRAVSAQTLKERMANKAN